MSYSRSSGPRSFRLSYRIVSASGSAAYAAPYGSENVDTITTTGYSGSYGQTKNWRRLIQSGRFASSSMTVLEQAFDCSQGFIELLGNSFDPPTPSGRKKRGRIGHFAPINDFPDFNAVPTGNADADAAGAYFRSCSDALSSFKGQIAAGESREALKMMATRAQDMLNMIPPWGRRVKKRVRHYKDYRERLKQLSDSYLELQYGWLPMARDIADAKKALDRARPLHQVVRGRGITRSCKTISESTQGAGGLNWRHRVTEELEYRVQYLGVMRLSPSYGAGALHEFGFHLNQFVPTLWEVLPWSFLVDYFTNVGEIINSEAMGQVQPGIAAKTVTKLQRRTYTAGDAWSTLAVTDSLSNVPSVAVATQKSVTRTIVSGVHTPELTFHMPTFRQTLNMAALAVSRRFKLIGRL